MKKLLIIPIIALLSACGKQDSRALYSDFYEPYMDLIGTQERTDQNAELVDAMVHYNAGEYAEALALLQIYTKKYRNLASSYMYMGICHMEMGESYKAELQFDLLDNIVPNGFLDQSEWYSALCLLYSEQLPRCREAMALISKQKKHAYKHRAAELLRAMDRNGL